MERVRSRLEKVRAGSTEAPSNARTPAAPYATCRVSRFTLGAVVLTPPEGHTEAHAPSLPHTVPSRRAAGGFLRLGLARRAGRVLNRPNSAMLGALQARVAALGPTLVG